MNLTNAAYLLLIMGAFSIAGHIDLTVAEAEERERIETYTAAHYEVMTGVCR